MSLAERWVTRDEDQIEVEVTPPAGGTWGRFAKLLWQAKLPVLSLVLLFVVSALTVNIGLDQAKYSAQIIAGNVSVEAVALFLGVVIAGFIIGSLTGLFGDIIAQIINRNLRRLVWTHTLRLPMTFFRKTPPNELISRITTDTEVLGNFVLMTVFPLFTTAYTTYAVAARLFEFDSRLALATLVMTPVLVFLTWVIGRFSYFTQRDVATRTTSLTMRLAEFVSNIPLIKAFGVVPRERERGDVLIRRLYGAQIRLGLVGHVSIALFSIVGLVQTVVIIAVGVALINSGDLTTAQWVTFFLYSATLAGVVSGLSSTWTEIRGVQGTTARIAEIIDAAPEFSGDAQPPADSRDLVVDRVTFGYDDQNVIHNVSHTFRARKLTVVVGPNGSGKSTLMSLLQRLDEPRDGVILLDGRPLQDYDSIALRSYIATVAQDVAIVSGSIRENLLLGLGRSASDDELIDALRFDKADFTQLNLPDGLDTQVGEFGSKLSGGQRHRIALGRAMLRDARLLLLDEPTAAMDAAATREVMDSIRRVADSRTTILIAHTPAAISIADEVVVIEDGRITAAGPVAQAHDDSAFLRDFLSDGAS